MLIKRDCRDRVFSNLVRARVNWTCEKCGRYFPEGERQGLHCSHFIGRAVRPTRWHSRNGLALCFGCHQFFEQRPINHTEFVTERVGEEHVEELQQLSTRIVRWRKPDLEEIYRILKDEQKRVNSLRNNGKDGPIDFIGAEALL